MGGRSALRQCLRLIGVAISILIIITFGQSTNTDTTSLPPIDDTLQDNIQHSIHSKNRNPVVISKPSDSNRRFVNVTKYYPKQVDDHKTSYIVVRTNHRWSLVIPQVYTKLQRTSNQAKDHHCNVVATNGGPFHADGSSCGTQMVR